MPKIQLPRKIERVLTTKARIIVLIGGRSSAKSESVARILLLKCQTEAADILCGREFQNSIDDSVHKLIKQLINTVPVDGFTYTDKKVDCLTGGGFRFKGFSRNPDTVKSAQNFKYSWVEEAQTMSQASIDDLLPTIRATGSQLIFTANPQSSADPFSQRFIVPFLDSILRDGYYEDDMHLVIMMNWRDNPWHGELEAQRKWDYENLPRAKYNHIWEGDFNDSVEDPLILAEWFDACIDAHKTLGIKPVGLRYASHDPSDLGPDPKGYAFAHGPVVYDVSERIDGNINQGCDWATGKAIKQNADAFTWDVGGMGVGLNRQVSLAFKGKPTKIQMFDGSKGVDRPDDIFDPIAADGAAIMNQKKNKDAFGNRRAQYYFELRKKVYQTYLAVNRLGMFPQEELISFDSGIKDMAKLRSELCRMPIKPNGSGLFELYTKREMKVKFKFASPNVSDCVMMLQRVPPTNALPGFVMPQPIRTMGVGSR